MTLDQSFGAINATVLIGSVVVNIYLFFKQRNDKRFDQMSASIGTVEGKASLESAERKAQNADLDKRTALVESAIANLPTHKHIDEIRSEMSKMAESLATVQERSKIQLDSMRRIESHLLSDGR